MLTLGKQDSLFSASNLNNLTAFVKSLMKHKTFSSKGKLQNNNREECSSLPEKIILCFLGSAFADKPE